MDRLGQILEMQEKLNTSVIRKLQMNHYNDIGVYSDKTDNYIRREWVDKFASALQAEVCEVREASLSNTCWWKIKTKGMDGVKEEIADCIFFTLSMALAAGMTAEDIYTFYKTKYEYNMIREDWHVNK